MRDTTRRQALGVIGAAALLPGVGWAGIEALPPHPDTPRLADGLGARMIFREAPVRRVLYTWTTADQITALRQGGRLLYRQRSARHGRSRFDRTLAEPAVKSHPMARRLGAEPHRRFAWPYPWATILGWPGEAYGDQLLRIELKPCWTAAARFRLFGPRSGTLIGVAPPVLTHHGWTWFGADGALRTELEPTAAEAARVGVVYHESAVTHDGHMGSFLLGGPSLREYVLFDEAHIAAFSHGDDACKAALTADIRFLDQLIENPWNARYGPISDHVATRWGRFDPSSLAPTRSWADSFAANLPWKNPHYDLTPGALKRARAAVDAALRAQGPALRRAL